MTLAAIFIPGDAPILDELTKPHAQAAIARGFRLFAKPNGSGVLLHPDRKPAPGWILGSVHVPADFSARAA